MKVKFQKFTWLLYVRFGIPALSIVFGLYRVFVPHRQVKTPARINIGHYYNLRFVPGYRENFQKAGSEKL